MERLERINQELDEENRQLKIHYIAYSDLQVKLEKAMELIVMSFVEVQSLRNRLNNKE